MSHHAQRVMHSPTCHVPLRPGPFTCPVCGQRLGYNFIVRQGPDGDGYYIVGHDRLIDDRPDTALTTIIEKTDLKAWRGMDGRRTIEAVHRWCRTIHGIAADPFDFPAWEKLRRRVVGGPMDGAS